VRFFAESKFYTQFSFLFGYGMALQMARAAVRQTGFVPLYARRLGVLLLIGAFHGVLFWAGDILLTYAILGFVLLLLFRNRRDKTLVIWACCFLFLPAIMMAAICGLIALAEMAPDGPAEMQERFEQLEREMTVGAWQAVTIYRHGSLGDILARRVLDLQQVWFMLALMAPSVMGIFLLGFMAGRRKWLHDPGDHSGTLRKILLLVLPLALVSNGAYVAVVEASSWIRPSWSWVLTMAIVPVAALSLASCYVSGLALLVQRPPAHKLLAPLAAVRRTALTNYLLQSVICSTLMCSYGMGLYGRVHPPVAVGLTVLIFVVQVWFSNWWLRRFRFGPAEWLWRSATYRRLQPMRI
jgi:uncharacterized protein